MESDATITISIARQPYFTEALLSQFRPPPPADCVLTVVDVQEKLAAAMDARYLQGHIRRAAKLVRAACRLNVPVLVTEQYSKGLGATLPVVREQLPPETRTFEKLEFACTDNAAYREALAAAGRRSAVLVGMEAHVCILQTAFGLQAMNLHPWVVADAVLSRDSGDYRTALALLRQAGIAVVTFEMLLFAWLRRAGTAEFRELSFLARDRDE